MQLLEYKGSPLSVIVPISQSGDDSPPAWIYAKCWPESRDRDPANMKELISHGWAPVPEGISAASLESQLYETIRLYFSDTDNLETWYKSEPEGPGPLPIVLAFTIHPSVPRQPQGILNPFPLSQFGEYAYILNAPARYYIMQLPLEARQRWVTLGEKLKELSYPLHWPPFIKEHQVASDDDEYQRQMNTIRTSLHIAIDQTQQQIFNEGVQLEAARVHITQLRNMLNKETLPQQWREVQTMARDLARDYYNYHQGMASNHEDPTFVQTQEASNKTSDVIDVPALFPDELMKKLAVEQIVKPKKPKISRPRREPTPIVAKGKDTIAHNSNQLNWEIMNALRDKSTYTHYPKYNLAEHKHTFMHEKGQLLITISAQEGEGWETVLNALNTLGDGCIDTYIAVMAMAIEQNGTNGDRLRTPMIINPDDVLAICCKEKSHGSYTPFQRAEVIKHLKTLSQSKVVLTMPGRPAQPKATKGKGKKQSGKEEPPKRTRRKQDQGTVLRAEGPLIELLQFKIGEYHTITGEEVWEKRSISVGPWASMMPGLNITTAMMFRSILAYSSKNQRYQKRIGLYLTQMFRVNARHKGQFPNGITMKALLEGSGIIPDKKNPGRFKDAVFAAIDQLKENGIIGAYHQIIDASAQEQEHSMPINKQSYGKAELYLQQKWNFSPPQSILNQYRNLIKEPEKQE